MLIIIVLLQYTQQNRTGQCSDNTGDDVNNKNDNRDKNDENDDKEKNR